MLSEFTKKDFREAERDSHNRLLSVLHTQDSKEFEIIENYFTKLKNSKNDEIITIISFMITRACEIIKTKEFPKKLFFFFRKIQIHGKQKASET